MHGPMNVKKQDVSFLFYLILYLLFCRHVTDQRFSNFVPAFFCVTEVVVITVVSQAVTRFNAWRRSSDVPKRRYVLLAAIQKNIFHNKKTHVKDNINIYIKSNIKFKNC
jgi:hypothetical protein